MQSSLEIFYWASYFMSAPRPDHPMLETSSTKQTTGVILCARTDAVIMVEWKGGPIVGISDDMAIASPELIQPGMKGYHFGPWYLEFLWRYAYGWVCICWDWKPIMEALTFDRATGEYL